MYIMDDVHLVQKISKQSNIYKEFLISMIRNEFKWVNPLCPTEDDISSGHKNKQKQWNLPNSKIHMKSSKIIKKKKTHKISSTYNKNEK